MKQLSEEMQKVYDFCEQKKNNLDKCAESTDDFNVSMMLTNQSTCYWAVQQFIEVNFMEE